MNKLWQGKSVVIVDDSAGVREHLTQTYHDLSVQIFGTARNGIEALECVAKTQPDLVSLDLIMPEMDGVECFKKLRRHFPEVRIIVISWLGSEHKIIENLQSIIPAHLFLPKPVDRESLSQKLDMIFGLPASASSPDPVEVDADRQVGERRNPRIESKVS